MDFSVLVIVAGFLHQWQPAGAQFYVIDDSAGLGRRFDGIGGLSGGGATSRLLVSYKDPPRSEILDLLFKPNFGASLQILKVEIGGDAQSTDGTEASHMHTQDDLNYQRGYEWWLMTEAKKRNPNIKLYGLSWAYPYWLGGKEGPYSFPYLTASYILRWIEGAKSQYNLVIDYVGIWNERNFNSDYIKILRKVLDTNGFESVAIVAADTDFKSISSAMLKDPELNSSVSIVGAHYPGTFSDADALATHKPLWASEDYSTYNDDVGAGCWARILNQNYVNGNMTSTISWNLIASYYSGLPYYRDGLMTAVEPWSGHYEVMGPIWISAHTTQFSEIGYMYLKAGSGVGHLADGGSYVTLMDPVTKDFTIVIETMSHDHSKCIRPSLPPYTVSPQMATFQLKGSMASVTSLNRWTSSLKYGSGSVSEYFIHGDNVTVESGTFTISLPVDTVVTLSTLSGQQKGSFPDIPPSTPFPLPYSDSFDSYPKYSEAQYFADQSGVFEITAAENKGGNVMVQTVPERPVTWCDDANQPNTLIGSITWQNVTAEVSVLLEANDTAAFLAVRMDKGGCGVASATGVFLWLDSKGFYNITTDLAGKNQVKSDRFPVTLGEWYSLQMQAEGPELHLVINGGGVGVFDTVSVKPQNGYVAMGTGGFYRAQFDNFYIHKAS
jgi:galactosylceramidase